MIDVVALTKLMKHTPQEEGVIELRNSASNLNASVSESIKKILEDDDLGHQLLTSELLERFDSLDFRTDEVDPLFITKFFCIRSHVQWYVCHFDRATGEFFGFINSEYPHWGTFNIVDLVEYSEQVPDMKVERSINFQEVRSSSVME